MISSVYNHISLEPIKSLISQRMILGYCSGISELRTRLLKNIPKLVNERTRLRGTA